MPAVVPEISFAHYRDLDSQQRAAFSTALMHGLQRFGFIVLRDHPVSQNLLDQAYDLSARFFAQENSAKRRYASGPRGFTPFRTERAKDRTEPNAGDMLARLTNDLIPATTHRVVNPPTGNRSRYSMPFFMHPDSDVTLSCLPSCIGSGAKYPDIRAGTFLEQRLRDIGLLP